MRFEPLAAPGMAGWLADTRVRLVLFVGLAGFLAFMIFLRRVLRQLDPSSVIPERVQIMLNALTEGILILDNAERIVMANEAFTQGTGLSPKQLQGRRIGDIPWRGSDPAVPVPLPWKEALAHGSSERGVNLCLQHGPTEVRTYSVNVAPILGHDGKHRGALATFDDVTAVEKTNAQLRSTLHLLEESQHKITRQNEELQILATRDHLTGCLNRRSFVGQLEGYWKKFKLNGGYLGCIMIDLDLFKRVNDTYGHATGDAVLKQMGEILRASAREGDLVCRYGGEEFCIVLPRANFEGAFSAATRLAKAIAKAQWPIQNVTASMGYPARKRGPVSSMCCWSRRTRRCMPPSAMDAIG